MYGTPRTNGENMKAETAIEEFEKRNPDWNKSLVYSKKYDLWYSKPKKLSKGKYGIVLKHGYGQPKSYTIYKNFVKSMRLDGWHIRAYWGYVGHVKRIKDAPEFILDFVHDKKNQREHLNKYDFDILNH